MSWHANSSRWFCTARHKITIDDVEHFDGGGLESILAYRCDLHFTVMDHRKIERAAIIGYKTY
ncbi:hypothetical protein D9M71_672600 [compost metagenome]